MSCIFTSDLMTDEQRRDRLYQGDLFVKEPSRAVESLVQFTRGMIKSAFGGIDPESAQYEMSVEAYAKLLGKLKPEFIHHPESKRLICEILADQGCDVEDTYFDVPRLRTSTSDNYLTSGIAYAFHPHRDTWYSAPMMQINWWLPVFELSPNNGLAFHPEYFGGRVENSSERYNYYLWNRYSRSAATEQLGSDVREQPKALEPVSLDSQVRPMPRVGGMTLFSGAQLHSSVPNDSGKTRFSIDFRTVCRSDVEAHRGAENVDSQCTGTTLRDFRRASDLSYLPEDLIAEYDEGVSDEVLQLAVYSPGE